MVSEIGQEGYDGGHTLMYVIQRKAPIIDGLGIVYPV
jgi:hypothetical protein